MMHQVQTGFTITVSDPAAVKWALLGEKPACGIFTGHPIACALMLARFQCRCNGRMYGAAY
jgi:hypothetical protein